MRIFRGELRDTVDLLVFGPGERLAAATMGREKVDVWDSATGQQADAWSARTERDGMNPGWGLPVSDLAFLADGRVVACVGGHPLQVIDPDTSDRHGVVFSTDPGGMKFGHANRVAAIADAAFSTHSHNSATIGTPPALVCWWPAGECLHQVAWSAQVGLLPLAVAASPDGGMVATAEFLPAPGSGRQVASLAIREGITGGIAHRITDQVLPWGTRDRLRFSPDGARVMAIRDDAVNFWDVASGEHAGRLRLSDKVALATDAAFHPSGRWLLTSGIDGKVRVWDAERLSEVNAFEWGIGRLRSVAVGADGNVAAAGGMDGNIVVWDLDL